MHAMGIYVITTGNKDLLCFTMTKNHVLLMEVKEHGHNEKKLL